MREEPRGQAPHLFVLGPGEPTVHELPPAGEVVVGRSSSADLQLTHASVSRRHARLSPGEEDETFALEDLGSANGTRLHGRRLSPEERVPLRFGEVFELGRVALLVHGSSHLADLAPHAAGDDAETTIDDDLVVRSDAMRRLWALVDRVARSRLHVVITGETGVGKERVAEELHLRSGARSQPLVRIACGALGGQLVESELFGHRRGAFTGATEDKRGLLERAHGGTVFLDDVTAIPLAAQSRLLRVIQEGRLRRVGDSEERRARARFVAASSDDLERAVEDGRLRRDLFYRLAGVRIHVPPLRERVEEIEPLALSTLAELAAGDDQPPPALDDGALFALRAHRWPGNVRELRNALARAWLLGGGADGALRRLTREHLDLEEEDAGADAPADAALRRSVDEAEKAAIVQALAETEGNQTRAAERLGISRRTLVSRLDKYGLPRPRKGRRGTS